MVVKLAIVAAVVAAVALAGVLWRRPPRRLTRLDPNLVGLTGASIVQFSAPYCAPCKRARPELQRIAAEANVRYVEVDLGQRPELARRYGIRSVPLIAVTAPDGAVLGRWTELPPDGEVLTLARAARSPSR